MTNDHKQKQSEIARQFCHKTASEQIARIYGVDAFIGFNGFSWDCYITQDLGALMELAIRNEFDIDTSENATLVVGTEEELIAFEKVKDHNNDPIEATRVAISKALIKKGGE